MEKKNLFETSVEESINDIISQLRNSKREPVYTTEVLDENAKQEIANKMKRDIYCYEYQGFWYYLTFEGLIDDFYSYITAAMSLDDDYYTSMSLIDYVERFEVEEYKPIKA